MLKIKSLINTIEKRLKFGNRKLFYKTLNIKE